MCIPFEVANHPLSISGGFRRMARLRDEYYDFINSPAQFVEALKCSASFQANILTFVRPISEQKEEYNFHWEYDTIAVLRIETYEAWWKKQINDKTRNMVRKAAKCGVEIRPAQYNDDFVRGIARIYNETPVRQGRRFRHYQKPFDTLKAEHGTFVDRSEFFGAYSSGELIGFIKLVHGPGVSNLMQIISMVSHRDKAPTNALIAKAVERCAARNVPLLHYGSWSRRSMGDFKKHHGFTRLEIPRYYVPLNWTGTILLKCGLHRSIVDMIPEGWLDRLAYWRGKWNTARYRNHKASGAVAQLAERHS
jgi:hypothetical protein